MRFPSTKVSLGPLKVIHNYGHGGSGITIFWGCAKDVCDLVKDIKNEKNLATRSKL